MIRDAFKICLDKMEFMDGIIVAIGLVGLGIIVLLSIYDKTPLFKKKSAKKRNLLINIYQFCIEVCPLLGTLGTVISLIVSAQNPDELQTTFLFALTTTFWGILMACLCKAFEAILISEESGEE